MKKLLYVFCLVFLFSDSLRNYNPDYSIKILDSPSEIVGGEDLMGRNEYFNMLTSDPNTGSVPNNLRTAELRFNALHRKLTAGARTQALTIESAGPINVGGRTRAVAFDVRNENIILAGGVSGGIWKSTDGGSTWIRKSDPENRNSVTCIVQDTRAGREDTWYHGTGELVGNSARGGSAPFRGNGIYKSVDNGETWNPILSTQDSDPGVFNSQFQYIWDIEINPENVVEDEVLVAVYGGILRSLDGGNSWQVELGQQLFGLDASVDLNESNAPFYTALERSDDNVFYATLSTESSSGAVSPEAGFYYSLDGANWENITPNSQLRYRRAVIGSSPSNPDITYFMVDSNPILILEHRLSLINSPDRIRGFNVSPGIVPSFDDELGNLDTQGSYNMVIRVHPTDPNTVFVGGTNLFRSTDGFKTESSIDWIGGYNPEGGSSVYPNHHPDQHELLFLPSDPNVAFSSNDGGIRRTSDITADSVIWESINNGFVTSQFFTIAQGREAGNNTLIGGMQDNGTDFSRDGNANWNGIIGGDGGFAATTRNNRLWFASFQRGQTLRLTLNGNGEITSFGRVDPGGLVEEAGSVYLFVNPFVLDPLNENRMFFAGGNHLYFHPNVSQIPGGSQVPTYIGWTKINPLPVSDGLVSAVKISFDGSVLYYGTSSGRIFRLNNAGDQSKFGLSEVTPPNFPQGYISSIAINPDNDQHLLVTFSNYNIPSIFESTDGGESFVDVSGNLEENLDPEVISPSVRWAEIVPKSTGNLLLAGTSIGLFSTETTSTNTTWVKESPTTIGSAVVTMMDYRPNDGKLVIATHGNGVFQSNIPDFKTLTLGEPSADPFQLLAAYPNPFLENTQIEYAIPEDGDVRVDILDTNGRLINTILWAPQFAGKNSVSWDGSNASGTPLANGLYLYRIRYNGQSQSGRLVLRR